MEHAIKFVSTLGKGLSQATYWKFVDPDSLKWTVMLILAVVPFPPQTLDNAKSHDQ